MTQTLIEKLKALIANDAWDYEHPNGDIEKLVSADDLRAIIEQHKQEAAEPVEYQIKILGERWTRCAKHIYDPNNPNTRALYSTSQPDIVAELVKALEDMVNQCESANARCLDQIGLGLIDIIGISKAKQVITKARKAVK